MAGLCANPGNPVPLAEQRSYTSAGQLAASALLQLTWDSAGRIAQITQQHMLPTPSGTVAQQVPLTSAYSYDASGRLTASAHSAPAGLTLPSGSALSDTIGANASGYAWDANGNRSQSYYSSSTAAGTATLQRDCSATGGSNRLGGYRQTFTSAGGSAQTTNVSYNHDATGSITRKGDSYLHYGVDGRIAKAGPNPDAANPLAVSYTYNALGQRVFKSDARLSGSNNPAITQQTVYAEDGIGSTVLGQYGSRRSADSAAAAGEMDSTEVIYLPTANGPMPVAAQINGRLYAIDADHLNTPRRLTNTQGQVAWQWLITGFGEANPTTGATGYSQSGQGSAAYAEAIKFDLRYPGQVWDEETQLAYNLNRYYDQASGRYIQADPIGLDGGWNRFGYVGGDPLSFVDPEGLQVRQPPPALTYSGGIAAQRVQTLLSQIRQYNPSYSYQAIRPSTGPGSGYNNADVASLMGIHRGYQNTQACTRDGVPIGRFIASQSSNVMLEPVGGSTVPYGRLGVDTHTLFSNGSNFQRLNPNGHPNNPTPHGHGHQMGTGPGRAGQGPSVDVNGNVVPANSGAAHWPLN